MCDNFPEFPGCGLVLHILDMGWCTQSIISGKSEVGLTFGPRYLMESESYNQNFAGEVKSFDAVRSSEKKFAGMVAEYAGLLSGKALPVWVSDDLAAGAAKHIELIADIRFKDAVVNL